MNQLAVVVPVYKPNFLSAALESLAKQSDRRFTVYVGDDASKHALEPIVRGFEAQMEIRFHRFASNLGSSDLVAQWTRCVALSSEPWVWLFSDDDLADPHCVSAFYDGLAGGIDRFDLLHFQTDIVDADGNLIRRTRAFPDTLSAHAFALGRLQLHWSSFAVEYVFRRSAWQSLGGFVNFPAAWCSDDATWVRLAGSTGIRTLPAGRVRWRQSGSNVTAGGSPFQTEKIEAMLRYMDWLIAYFDAKAQPRDEIKSIRDAFHRWFFTLLGIINPLLGRREAWRLQRQLKKRLSSSGRHIWAELLRNQYLAGRTRVKRGLARYLRIGGR